MSGNIISILGYPFTPPETPDVDPPETQLHYAMERAGVPPPQSIHIDGQLHRYPTGPSGTDDAGWYVAFPDGIPAGRFGDFRQGIEQRWIASIGRDLSAAENMSVVSRLKEAQDRRAQEKETRNIHAARTAAETWASAPSASDNYPYLQRKGIQPHGARVASDGRLIVPMYRDGELSSLQYIDTEGEKRYQKGGAAKGAYYLIGEISNSVFIAEGFATGATIYEETGIATVIAYSAGNIPDVTGIIREKYPASAITICADLDESGVGKNYSDQAAAKYGARVVVSPVASDLNDFRQGGGDIAGLLDYHTENWLVHADEFSKKPEPIKWLVKKWVQDNAMIMVHGPSGAGKTFVVLDWCMRIASGTQDWGGNIVHSGPVVYLAGEGHHGLRARISAWKQAHKIDSLNMYLSKSGTDLNTPEGVLKVTHALASIQENPRLIVVDTLHRFLLGDENTAKDTKSMLDSCAVLMQEFSCSVLLVHHTGVNAEAQHRARGSSAWKGALDNEISIIAKGDKLKITAVKMKDSEYPEPVYCELEQVPISGWIDEDGEQVTSAVPVITEAPKESKAKNKDVDIFERAWFASGADEVDGLPYLTRSAWANWMVNQDRRTKTAGEQAVKASGGGIATRMIRDGFLQDYLSGYILIDPGTAGAMMSDKHEQNS